MLYSCCSSVFVICKYINDYRNTCCTVSFKASCFVVFTGKLTCTFFDCSFNIIIRHVYALCLIDGMLKSNVIFRISTVFSRNSYRSCVLCKHSGSF